MTAVATIAEAGLAGESTQTAFDAPTLTQTSSHTNVDGVQAEKPLRNGSAEEGSLHGDAEKVAGAGPAEAYNEATLLTGFRLYAVFGAMMLGVFMFALDQSVSGQVQ